VVIGRDAGSVPRLVLVFGYVGTCIAATILAAASCRPRARHGWSTRAVIGLLAAGLSASSVWAGDSLELHPDAHSLVPQVLGWAGVGCAVLCVSIPARALGHHGPATLGALAGAPFLLGLVAYLAAGRTPGTILGSLVEPWDVVGQAVVNVFLSLQLAIVVLGLWAGFAAARQASVYGRGCLAVVERAPLLLVVLVLAKIEWLVLGYLDHLPGWFQGSVDRLQASRTNGAPAWAIAAVLAAAGLAWLAWSRGSRGRSGGEERLGRPAAAIALGSAWTIGASAVVFLLAQLALALQLTSWARGLRDAVFFLLGGELGESADLDVIVWPIAATVAACALAGLALLRAGRGRPAAIFLLVYAAWNLARAFAFAWTIVTEEQAPFEPPTPTTLDACVTVGVALLGLLWLAGRQRTVGPGSLTLVLAVSTVVAHPGFLLPTGWRTGILFFLALVYAPAWAFLFDAEGLNRRTADRAERVLRAVGIAAILLVLASFQVGGGLVGPDQTNPLQALFGSVGRAMLTVPVAAVLVGTLVLGRRAAVDR
jgi:hypothetical protein